MSYVLVDVEADGPIPGDYSMISIGAVIVEPSLSKTFYATLKPISVQWVPEALAVTGISRDETLTFDDPAKVMLDFKNWLFSHSKGKPMFISDNNGFDWMFVCWYFHHFIRENPFGHSSSNLGSLYKGVVGDVFQNFKHLRKRVHTHNALDDALGNAEALLQIKEKYKLKIPLD